MSGLRRSAKHDTEYVRTYERPRGVDFSEIPSSGSRFADLENMYVDYGGGADAVESVPGFRKIIDFGERINGIHLHNLGESGRFLLIHAGYSLYRVSVEKRDSLSYSAPIAELEDTRSHSFAIADKVYVMDGQRIIRVDGDGKAQTVADGGDAAPYVPTLYDGGIKKEERNLLTDRYREKFFISEKFAFYTKGLTFSVRDPEKRTCALTGALRQISGELHIPKTAVIDGAEYRVCEIVPSAFMGCGGITAVFGGENLEIIGKYAFKDCVALKTAVFGGSLKYIDYAAFSGTDSLTDLYVGLGFGELAAGAFSDSGIQRIHYAGGERDAEKIIGLDSLANVTLVTYATYEGIKLGFPLGEDAEAVDGVFLNGKSIAYEYDPISKEVIFSHSDKSEVIGSVITVEGTLANGALPKNAISGCTVSTAHDGRIFLSGNPSLPGYVFYSSDTPGGELYFAECNCFSDGVGNYPVTSLLSSNGTLTVFKSDDDGSGSIFCHTSDGKGYPLTYTHGGVSNGSASYVLADDAVFLSSSGLSALEKVAGSNYRALRCRSTNVNRRLLQERISDVAVTEWCGYLVLCIDGRIYLADSRDKFRSGDSYEYEWYYLNGIGSYNMSDRVYRYSPLPKGGCEVREDSVDEIAYGEPMSVKDSDGEAVYYVTENGIKYRVYQTDEFRGGNFSPALTVLGLGELLFFGTESGVICVFNNDKRGIAPDYIKNASDFNKKAYAEAMGDKIHPYYYTFDGRAARYAMKTKPDDCEIPYLTKSTVKHSLTLKCKNYCESAFYAEVSTNDGRQTPFGKYSASRLSFSDLDFADQTFSTSPYSVISLPEREKNWVEKQISLLSEDFRTPFGVCSFAFRYKVKGNIKHTEKG